MRGYTALMMVGDGEYAQMIAHDRLFHVLTEQLKIPLLQISQHIELARSGAPVSLDHMEAVTDMALRLLDGYALSRQLSLGQAELLLEPVSVSSVLHDSAERLSAFAREYECDIELRVSGRYNPVMAHRQGLEAALTALGYSLIEAQSQDMSERPKLIFAAHKSRWGVVAGVFADQAEVSSDAFKRAKLLYGRSRQPIPTLSHSSSAGIFVADSLLSAMAAKLHVARHSKLNGLAATLTPNMQLRMIES